MKQFILITLLGVSSFLAGAQNIPLGYYDGTESVGGDALKTVLNGIIKGHSEFEYTSSSATDVWDILSETDKDPNNSNNVILIYSGRSVASTDHSLWNREHVWAKSRGDFGIEIGAGTDVHHLRPCDPSVNSARNNRWFAECTEEYIDNGFATGSYSSSSQWVWKPRNETKGDVARMMFYMATRYEGLNGELDLELIDFIPTDQYTNAPENALLSDLLLWHVEDPVDAIEIARNDVIFSYQGNRNPFIDHPEFVECIWNNNCSGYWFASSPTTEMTEREAYSYDIVGSGTDAQLTVTGEIIPSWLTFIPGVSEIGNATATIAGQPSFSDIGTHSVSIKISDGVNLPIFQDFNIIVSDGNTITFTSTPEIIKNAEELYSYTVTATGDNGANLIITGTTLPAWLSLDGSSIPAILSGTAALSDLGNNLVILTLSDDSQSQKTITQEFTINILDPNDVNTIIITQYYEGSTGSNKFIELTNIGSEAVSLSNYHLARWSTTGSPSGSYIDNGNGGPLSGSIAAGETQVYKHASAAIPAYAIPGGIPTTAGYINGDDPIGLLLNGDTWDYRVDCIYSSVISPKWGESTCFYRKANVTSGNINPSILDGTGEWVEITEATVLNASANSTEYLGFFDGVSNGIEDLSSYIKLYPNPVKDVLFIETVKYISEVEIVSLTGKSIKKLTNFKTNTINTSAIIDGIYFLKITSKDGNVETMKFVKQ